MKGLVGPLVGGGPGARAPWAPLKSGPVVVDIGGNRWGVSELLQADGRLGLYKVTNP